MRMIMKMLTNIALLIMVAACATTTTTNTLPSKYNLDSDLNAVSRISAVRVSNWEQVDNQSVMCSANGAFYLLVLDRPLEEMDQKIGFLANSSSVLAGSGKIYVGSSSNKRYYNIEKIYKLDGTGQLKEIKDQLSNS